MKIDRLQAFSDGVFAILLTLLVLDFKLHNYQAGHLGQAVIAQWPILAAYMLSFFYVGTLWLFHHDYFAKIKRTNWQLNILNLILLFAITLINYPTSLLSEAVAQRNLADIRFAFTSYALVALVISGLFWVLYRFMAVHQDLMIHQEQHEQFYRAIRNDPLRSVLIYVIALVGIQFNVVVGALLILLGNIFHFIAYLRLSRNIEKHHLIE
ncbi:TMEM175 family protein [Latilactobacillus sakei]|uniref:TMEM175 family protein n=1 Tax=Latilactobacillus sakei TaxID=1599 RepID=UPI00202EA653|nr:TMEM175 family protein [Latilactobacillus sakei]MCM1598556.1 TMEM175 family protein [Latilactobacillus sakei]